MIHVNISEAPPAVQPQSGGGWVVLAFVATVLAFGVGGLCGSYGQLQTDKAKLRARSVEVSDSILYLLRDEEPAPSRELPFELRPGPSEVPIILRPGPGELPILLQPGPGEIPIELKPAGDPKVADPKPDTAPDPRMPQPPSNVMPQPRRQ